jgi:hypothetical protein
MAININHQTDTIEASGGTLNLPDFAGGGGLTHFVESEETASPNATVPVDALTATNASYTDIDVALVAKGTGATLAQVPDGTTAGGNKRGTQATDWQKTRTSASQVASGSYATVAGGYNNTASGLGATVAGGRNNSASGTYATVAGGYLNISSGGRAAIGGGQGNNASVNYASIGGGLSNTASSTYSFVGGGQSNEAKTNTHATCAGGYLNDATGQYSSICGGYRNTASGQFSFVGSGNQCTATGSTSAVVGGQQNSASSTFAFVGGGISNTASNAYATVVGGSSNTASSQFSFVSGGRRGTTRSIEGNHVFPACSIPITNAQGVTQSALLLLGRETTDATTTVLASNASAASTTNQVILPNNSAYSFTGEVIAGVTAAGDTARWTIDGAIKRGANAASTAMVGTPTVTMTHNDAGAAAWTVAVTADTTNGGVKIEVTGAAATTIRWVCKINTTEMTY